MYLVDTAAGTETRLVDENASPTWTVDGRTLFLRISTSARTATLRWEPTRGVEEVRNALWSPDGTAVAFSQPTDPSERASVIWIEKNGVATPITPAEPEVVWAALAWSADGKRLALVRYQRRPKGTGPLPNRDDTLLPVSSAPLYVTDGDVSTGQVRWLVDVPASWGSMGGVPDVVVWSPDGRFLTVGVGPNSSCASCRAGGRHFYAVPVDGGSTVTLDKALVEAQAISWAPDGSFVVLSVGGLRETYLDKQLVRFDPSTGARRELSRDESWADIEPSVSPDGQQIAFARGPALLGSGFMIDAIASRHIWLMQSDGSSPRQITNAPGWSDEAPIWTPDGRWIVFVRWRPKEEATPSTIELWAVRPDGSQAQRLVADLGPPRGFNDGLGFYGKLRWHELFAVTTR